MVWTQLNFVGTSPKGISNHKGVADNDGRIVVFGGYNVYNLINFSIYLF